MSKSGDNRRRWKRVAIDKAAEVRVEGILYGGTTNDISAGGASFNVEIGTLSEESAELSIDDLGEYDVSVVRKWDDGFAVIFDLNEDDQYSLQEELESFRREIDLKQD